MSTNEASSSRQVRLPPPIHAPVDTTNEDPYGRFSFERASQAQIRMSHLIPTLTCSRYVKAKGYSQITSER